MDPIQYKSFNVNQRINLKGNMQILCGTVYARRGWWAMLDGESDNELNKLARGLVGHNWAGENDWANIHSKAYTESKRRKAAEEKMMARAAHKVETFVQFMGFNLRNVTKFEWISDAVKFASERNGNLLNINSI